MLFWYSFIHTAYLGRLALNAPQGLSKAPWGALELPLRDPTVDNGPLSNYPMLGQPWVSSLGELLVQVQTPPAGWWERLTNALPHPCWWLRYPECGTILPHCSLWGIHWATLAQVKHKCIFCVHCVVCHKETMRFSLPFHVVNRKLNHTIFFFKIRNRLIFISFFIQKTHTAKN